MLRCQKKRQERKKKTSRKLSLRILLKQGTLHQKKMLLPGSQRHRLVVWFSKGQSRMLTRSLIRENRSWRRRLLTCSCRHWNLSCWQLARQKENLAVVRGVSLSRRKKRLRRATSPTLRRYVSLVTGTVI